MLIKHNYLKSWREKREDACLNVEKKLGSI